MSARIAVLAAPWLLASCVTFSFERNLAHTPLDDAALDALQPGRASLEQCLERLGAPLYVWEYKGNGVALAYGWQKQKRWNVSVSVPLVRGYSASGSYTDDASKLRGAVLFFDDDLELELVRRGFLQTLRAELAPRRPAPVEESLSEQDAEDRGP
jgi:hypothetical protein